MYSGKGRRQDSDEQKRLQDDIFASVRVEMIELAVVVQELEIGVVAENS